MIQKPPFVVLMAEDNKDDIVATRRAWKQHGIANPLQIVRDGEECLEYLRGEGRYSEPGSAPQAGVLLLDLRMPRLDGLKTLAAIRTDPGLRRLPVVVLTTSQEEEDRVQSYDLGANAFIRKPLDFESFSKAIRTIHLFWRLVDLPDAQS